MDATTLVRLAAIASFVRSLVGAYVIIIGAKILLRIAVGSARSTCTRGKKGRQAMEDNGRKLTRRLVVDEAEKLIDAYFPVLDHGFVGLVEYMGGDELIERFARNSYKYGTKAKTSRRTLIRSLLRRGHTSPFESFEIVLHCAVPIFVARQWIRIRTASLNEMSGRYSIMPMLFYTPELERIGVQSKTDKQGTGASVSKSHADMWLTEQKSIRSQTIELYRWSTEHDFARELARIDLPLSTYTMWLWKIDGNNLLRHLSLRCDDHAQWETRQFFNVIAGMAKRMIPDAFEAWIDYHFTGARMSRMDLEAIRFMLHNGLGSVEPMGEGEFTKERIDVVNRYMENVHKMGKTERAEFWHKLERRDPPSFDLDMSNARDPSFFENAFALAAQTQG